MHWLAVLLWALVNPVLSAKAEISDSKYKVNYFYSNIPYNIAKSFVSLNDEISQFGFFETLNVDKEDVSEKYLCFRPKEVVLNTTISITNGSVPLSGDELRSMAVNQITASFPRNTCVYSFGMAGGYWTYAYCFGDKIIQFHEDVDHLLQTGQHKAHLPDAIFTLGRFNGARNVEAKIMNQAEDLQNHLQPRDFLVHDDMLNPFVSSLSGSTYHSQKVLSHELKNGGICDVTGQPRSVEVIYKCDPNNRGITEIVEVQEIKTCQYQMVINVPKLCAIEEFRPVNNEDKVKEIDCKLIDQKNEMTSDLVKYEEFFYYGDDLPYTTRLFPLKKGFKINYADYIIFPCGSGFHVCIPKWKPTTSSAFWNNRYVLQFNGEYSSTDDLLDKLGRVLTTALERKFPSPIFLDNGIATTLNWQDTFVAWYELYDFYGKFITMVRITRDGTRDDHDLGMQLVDPETMKDQDGDPVEIRSFDAPNNKWNFESFTRTEENPDGEKATKAKIITDDKVKAKPKTKSKKKAKTKEVVKEKTVFVTVTVSEESKVVESEVAEVEVSNIKESGEQQTEPQSSTEVQASEVQQSEVHESEVHESEVHESEVPESEVPGSEIPESEVPSVEPVLESKAEQKDDHKEDQVNESDAQESVVQQSEDLESISEDNVIGEKEVVQDTKILSESQIPSESIPEPENEVAHESEDSDSKATSASELPDKDSSPSSEDAKPSEAETENEAELKSETVSGDEVKASEEKPQREESPTIPQNEESPTITETRESEQIDDSTKEIPESKSAVEVSEEKAVEESIKIPEVVKSEPPPQEEHKTAIESNGEDSSRDAPVEKASSSSVSVISLEASQTNDETLSNTLHIQPEEPKEEDTVKEEKPIDVDFSHQQQLILEGPLPKPEELREESTLTVDGQLVIETPGEPVPAKEVEHDEL
ncbi:uncharacterized protein RJT20DRAFT_131409 [Scheffersomyces xylosifermentans]|uniref:uncharacterized protein n=1 Tax=Scheffersomyces xylosifermentans TaxID=1304137 RepID=UPI00315DCCC2